MSALYATPRTVTDVRECFFYHTMDIPGVGPVQGVWDLRQGVADYLGHADVRGRRVLEIGTASGFLCFSMERLGAEVVAYDLSDDYDWDVVPFSRQDPAAFARERRAHIRRLNNAFWLGHAAFRSQAKVVYGTVYDIPAAIGPVDVATFGSVLLHLRDPFRALHNALRLTRETVIVSEPSARLFDTLTRLGLGRPYQRFLPNFRTGEHMETWWLFTPEAIQHYIGVLGFEDSTVHFHHQPFMGKRRRMFTVVGRRTQPLPEPSA